MPVIGQMRHSTVFYEDSSIADVTILEYWAGVRPPNTPNGSSIGLAQGAAAGIRNYSDLA